MVRYLERSARLILAARRLYRQIQQLGVDAAQISTALGGIKYKSFPIHTVVNLDSPEPGERLMLQVLDRFWDGRLCLDNLVSTYIVPALDAT